MTQISCNESKLKNSPPWVRPWDKFHYKAKSDFLTRTLTKFSYNQNYSPLPQNAIEINESKHYSTELPRVPKICSNYWHKQQNHKINKQLSNRATPHPQI